MSFPDRYKPSKGYIVSLNYENSISKNSTQIKFLPFVKFIERLKKDL